MSTESGRVVVEGIEVEIVRKAIKNLHLAVYPPDGRVRIAVPRHIDDTAARLAVVTRLPWVRRKQASVIEQARESHREMVSGESHHVGGHRYRLEVVESDAPPQVSIKGNKTLRLQVRPGTDRDGRQWPCSTRGTASALREPSCPGFIERLVEPKLGVDVADWRVKRMKTRWGSCSVQARRIWLNLELAKKSERCLEYIVVHEMVHLLEPSHNDRFRSLVTRHLPSWESEAGRTQPEPPRVRGLDVLEAAADQASQATVQDRLCQDSLEFLQRPSQQRTQDR